MIFKDSREGMTLDDLNSPSVMPFRTPGGWRAFFHEVILTFFVRVSRIDYDTGR